jgi:hypothetical protein
MGINPAPTEQVGQALVGAGVTPARADFHNLRIAQIRKFFLYGHGETVGILICTRNDSSRN